MGMTPLSEPRPHNFIFSEKYCMETFLVLIFQMP